MNLPPHREGRYWLPTPEGAYHAVASVEDTLERRFLRRLLSLTETPEMADDFWEECCEGDSPEAVSALLERLWRRGWVQELAEPRTVTDRPLEEVLPGLLAGLSDGGGTLLADPQGFYIASSGFPHQTAEELAALSADLLSLHQRHRRLLADRLGLETQAWGMIDAGGHSRLGIWPLHIGRHCFALVMTGIPHFNHPHFVDLVWILTNRYAPSSIPL